MRIFPLMLFVCSFIHFIHFLLKSESMCNTVPGFGSVLLLWRWTFSTLQFSNACCGGRDRSWTVRHTNGKVQGSAGLKLYLAWLAHMCQSPLHLDALGQVGIFFNSPCLRCSHPPTFVTRMHLGLTPRLAALWGPAPPSSSYLGTALTPPSLL